MVQEKVRESVNDQAEKNDFAGEQLSAREQAHFLPKDVLSEKKQAEGNINFRSDFEKELKGADDRALTVFKGEKQLNSYSADERKEVMHGVVEGFNKLGYEGEHRKEAANELAQELFNPMQMSLEQAEADFNLDPKIVAAAREAGVKEISYNGAVDKSEVSEIIMVVEDIGAAEKFQEQTGGAARIVSSRGLEQYQKQFADFLAQSDPDDTSATAERLDQFYGKTMDYASGKSVDSADDFGWLNEMMAKDDTRQLNERNAHKYQEAARLLQGAAGEGAQGEGSGQPEAQLQGGDDDAADDALNGALKDAAEHVEKNAGEHSAEHADEKPEHRGELVQMFDQLVEHKNQRENPEGEGYLSEALEKNMLASHLEYKWMKDAREALEDLKRSKFPEAPLIEGTLRDITEEGAFEMVEAPKKDGWESFRESHEQLRSQEAELLEQLEACREFAAEDPPRSLQASRNSRRVERGAGSLEGLPR